MIQCESYVDCVDVAMHALTVEPDARSEAVEALERAAIAFGAAGARDIADRVQRLVKRLRTK